MNVPLQQYPKRQEDLSLLGDEIVPTDVEGNSGFGWMTWCAIRPDDPQQDGLV